MSAYQADFQFRDAEEGLTPLGTVSVPISRDVFRGLIASKVVEFAGHLFCFEDNTPPSAPEHQTRHVFLVEARPAKLSAFGPHMASYDDFPEPSFAKETSHDDRD